MGNHYVILYVFLIFSFFYGCGTSTKSTHYFVAVDQETLNKNFYRVDVNAVTTAGKADLKTGWYSRKALDQIFSEVEADADTADEIVDKFETTLTEIWAKYLEALKDKDFAEADECLDSMNRMIAASQSYLSAGATAKEAAENAGKRFVYVYASDPSPFFNAVQQAVQSEQLGNSLQTMLLTNSNLGQLKQELGNQVRGLSVNEEMLIKNIEASQIALNAFSEESESDTPDDGALSSKFQEFLLKLKLAQQSIATE